MEAVGSRQALRAYQSGKDYRPEPDRIARCIKRDRQAMKVYRDNRADLIRLAAGHYYSDRAAPLPDPVNLLGMYQSVITRTLVSKNPRFMLSTFDRSASAAVATCQDALNARVIKMNLAWTLQMGIVDALWCMGIFYTHLVHPLDAARLNWGAEAGTWRVGRVSLDDFSLEMEANTLEECAYMAHRAWVPHRAAEDFYKRKLPVSYPSVHNNEGDERAMSVKGQEDIGSRETVEDMTCVWVVCLLRHGATMVMSDSSMGGPDLGEGGAPLAIDGYYGPTNNPYDILGFGYVSDGLIPKGPGVDLRITHEAANVGYRKMHDIIIDMKEVGLTRKPEDAKSIMGADHGVVVSVDDPEAIQTATYGAKIAQQCAVYAENFRKLFNQLGNNLELLGGLAPQSGTATQDTLLNNRASEGTIDMQDRVDRVVTSIGEKGHWYEWNHPNKVTEAPFEVPGLPETRRMRQAYPDREPYNRPEFGRDVRRGEAPTVRVDPYSMRAQTPQQKASLLLQFVQGVYQPLAQLWLQAGMEVDPHALVNMLGEYWDNPDLAKLLQQAEPLEAMDGPHEAGGASKPHHTTREVMRRTVSENQDSDIMQMLKGGAAREPGANGAA